MDTTREVNWNLFIGNLYKWKYKEFLPLFVSANEQPLPHKTQLLQWDLTCLNHNILSFLRRTIGVWYWFIVVDLLGYTLSQLMTYYLYFSLLTLSVFGSFLNSMHPQFSLQGGSISMDIKPWTKDGRVSIDRREFLWWWEDQMGSGLRWWGLEGGMGQGYLLCFLVCCIVAGFYETPLWCPLQWRMAALSGKSATSRSLGSYQN